MYNECCLPKSQIAFYRHNQKAYEILRGKT